MPKHRDELSSPFHVALRDFERRLLREALQVAGSQNRAAEILGISQPLLSRRCKKLGGVFDGEPIIEPNGQIIPVGPTGLYRRGLGRISFAELEARDLQSGESAQTPVTPVTSNSDQESSS